jgi:glycosyltransferase involved in cell wall biosynthesis
MANLLVIAYYYPPAGGAGVQRTLKHVKYLPDFGWNPVVLTVNDRLAILRDPSLAAEVPVGIPVHRAPALLMPQWLPWRLRNFITRWLLVVDDQLGWLPFAVSHGLKIINQGKISAIYSTSSPATAHLVAERLNRDARLPWIADFRDPLLDNFALIYPTRIHRQIVHKLEEQVCRRASVITVVSEPMRLKMLHNHPHIDPTKVVTITNGYDPTDLITVAPAALESSIFHIIYTGSFYTGRLTPESFLNAVRRLLDEGDIPSQFIKIHLIGNIGQPVVQLIADLDLEAIVDMPGYVPHATSIAYLLAADILLLVIGSNPGSEVVFTGKIFEYLAAGKPILALVPPGAAADLIYEAHAGWVVDPEDIQKIADRLEQIYALWREGKLNTGVLPEVVTRYERRKLTGELAYLLDSASRSSVG